MQSENPNTEWDGGDGGVAVIRETPQPILSEVPWRKTDVPQPATHQGAGGSEKQPESTTAAVADESPVPETYKELLIEHSRLYHAIPRQKSKAARKKMTERHVIVKSKLAAMQNGAPPPVITADDHAKLKLARLNQPASRGSRLEKLNVALAACGSADRVEGAGKFFLSIPLTPLRPVSDVIRFLLKCPWVALSVAVLREAIALYEVQLLEHWALVYPKERLAEIRDAEINNSSDSQRIAELHAESARLASPTAALTSQNTRLALQKLWEPVKDAEFRLLVQCQIELERDMTESQLAHERNASATHPLKIWDLTLQEIEQRIEANVKPSEVALPQLSGVAPKTGEHTALTSLLGLGVLAEE